MNKEEKLRRTSVLSGVLATMGIVRFLCLLGGVRHHFSKNFNPFLFEDNGSGQTA